MSPPTPGPISRPVEALLRSLGVRDGAGFDPRSTLLRGSLLPEEAATTLPAPAPRGSLPALPRIAVEDPRDGAVPNADFELRGLIGEGGMGRVHLARQRSLDRDVAIKSLRAEVPSPRDAEQLRSEATVMGRLEHPHVVPVHAVGLDPAGRLLLVMKRIDGVAWSELIHRPDHPRWAALLDAEATALDVHLDILEAVARAAHYAHEHRVIHRDLKPDNVLVGPHGDVYLADWGVALQEDAGETEHEIVGTPQYMPRELVEGNPTRVGRRTDVFLLGACLHEVLTGQAPHDGTTLLQVLAQAYDAEPKRYGADVPPELATIARTAMARDPEHRFESAQAFRRAIAEVRRHRVSIALAREGQRLLGAIGSSRDTEIDRLLTEARFAFLQALRDWPENVEAKEGLAAAVRRAIVHELDRESAGAARALLAELPVPAPDLAQRLEALDEQFAQRRAGAERLERIEAEQDLEVGRRARSGVIALIASLVSVATVLVLLQAAEGAETVTGPELVLISAVLLLACVIALIALRARLLQNAVNRRIAALAAASSVALLLHRMIAVAWGVGPEAMQAMDLTVLTFIGVAGAAIVPRLLWAAPIGLLGMVASAMFPAAIGTIFPVTGLLVTFALAFLLASARHPPDAN